MTQGTIMFWAKFQNPLNFPQKGAILDCQKSLTIRLDNQTLRISITQNTTSKTGAFTTTQQTTVLNSTIFITQSKLIETWNHYAITIQAKRLILYINNELMSNLTLTLPTINTISNYCTIGNNEYLNESVSMDMRHLSFHNVSYNKTTDIQTLSRQIIYPNQQNVLGYYSFGRDFRFEDTYFRNTSRDYKTEGVSIEYSSEPEKVCYCTQSNPNFMLVNKNFTLKQLSSNPVTSLIDSQGVKFLFQISALRLEQNADTVLFSVINYTDIVLSNNGQFIKVNLYAVPNIISESQTFINHRFRYSYWTTYTVEITSNNVILYVDGVQVEQLSHNTALPIAKNAKIQILSSNLVYLLNHIQVSTPLAANPIFNLFFTQDLLMPGFQTSNTSTGQITFMGDNRLCSQSETSTILSGNSCRDTVNAANFTSSTTSTTMSAMLKSSIPTATIEFWMKDLSNLPFNIKQPQVIFENTLDGKNVMTSICIMNSQNSNLEASKQIRFVPNVQAPQKMAILQTGLSNNHWIHVSLISRSSELRIIIFNNTNQQTISSTFSNVGFLNYSQELNTSIGSSFNGGSKFIGLLRELRIWQVSLSDDDIANYRYSSGLQPFFSNINNSGSNLLYYFRMNEGVSYNRIVDIQSGGQKFINEKSTSLSSIQWVKDDNLTICGLGFYQDGSCCQAVDLNGIHFKFQYSVSKNQIIVLINDTYNNKKQFESIFADISIEQIGNDFDEEYRTNVIEPTFNVLRTKGFNVSSDIIKGGTFSITLKATIYSLYHTRQKVLIEKLSIQCPSYKLIVNDMPISDDNNYVASSQVNHFLQVKVQTIDNQCYNPAKQQIEEVALSKVTWTQSVATPTFATLYDISTNQQVLTAKPNVSFNGTVNRINAQIFYNSTFSTVQFVVLNYQNVKITTGLGDTSSQMRNYLKDSQVEINFQQSSFITTNETLIGLPMSYEVVCPQEIFKSTDDYDRFCFVNYETKIFSIHANNDFNIDYSKKYQFQFRVGIQGYAIIREVSINMTFYQDGSSLAKCPDLIQASSLEFDKLNNTPLNIKPNPYLYCNGIFYEFVNVTWNMTEQISKKIITGGLSFNVSNPLSAFMRNDNAVLLKIASGTNFLVNANYTLRQADSSTYLNVKPKVQPAQFIVSVKSYPLSPAITLLSANRTVIDPLAIRFLEANITLNASKSSDPDNQTAVISYEWTCPSIVTNCSALIGGTRNNSLIINIWHKIRFGFLYNTNYTFTLTVWAKDNPYKLRQSLDYNISFSPPQINETNSDMKPTACETLDVPYSDLIYKDQYDKVIKYSKTNITDAIFNIVSKTDNGTEILKSVCNQGNVTEQVILYYLHGGILSNTSSPLQLFSQLSPSKIQKTISINQDLSQVDHILNIPLGEYVATTIYVLTRRQLNQNRTFINVQNVYLYRERADLIAVLSQSEISIDKYQNLIIDASPSYDAETGNSSNFKYSWTCPNNLAQCDGVKGSKLNVTYQTRANNSLNEIGDVVYNYGVTIEDANGLVSPKQAQASVQFTQKDDYSYCIQVTTGADISTQDLLSDTYYLEYNQPTNITILMRVIIKCENVNILVPTWSPLDSNQSAFWNVDSTIQNRIQIKSNQIKQMIPGQTNTVVYSQGLTMGIDNQTIYHYQTQVKFFLKMPDIQPIINGSYISLKSQELAIYLDASNSYDPINESFTCQWDCPSYFGGESCSDECNFTMSFTELKALIQPEEISYYLQQSHQFNVTMTSVDSLRSNKASQWIFLSDGLREPFRQSFISNCYIQGLTSFNNSKIRADKLNSFMLNCSDQILQDYIMGADFQYQWSVNGLNSTFDYYVINKILYIRPYALSKLQVDEVVIILNNTLVNVTSTQRRILDDPNQDDAIPDVYVPEYDNSNSEIDSVGDYSSSDEVVVDPLDRDSTNQTDNNDQIMTDQNNQTSDNSTDQTSQDDPSSNDTIDNNQTSKNDTVIPSSNNTNQTNNTDLKNQTNNTDIKNQTDNSNKTNNTYGDNQTITDPDNQNQTDPGRIIPRYSNDSSFKKSYKFKRNVLDMGSVNVTTLSNKAYTSNFTFSFIDFKPLQNTQIFFQLRGFQQIYDSQQVIIPIKPFRTEIIQNYYGNLTVPIMRDLCFDFFDILGNYVGSYSLNNTVAVENITSGTYKFNSFDRLLLPICQKTQFDYPKTDSGLMQFEKDIYQLLMMTEMIVHGQVSEMSEVLANSYAQKILAYLRLSFKTVLAYFDPSMSQEIARAKYNIQKQVLLIFYNLIGLNSGIEERVLSMLDVLDSCTQDYNSLIDNVADPEFIRGVVVIIERTINVQLVNTNITNKQQYIDRVNQVENKVVQNDIQQISSQNQSIIVQDTDKSSRTVITIDQSTTSIQATNNLNQNETVYVNNPQALQKLGIKLLDIQYTQDQNKSSALQTALTINAFDQNMSKIDVSFMQSGEASFQINMQLNDSVRKNISDQIQKGVNYNKQVMCAFFDYNKGLWSNQGVETVSFNPDTGVAQCKSYHLSTFSVLYFPLGVVVTPNNTFPNSTNQNNTLNVTDNKTQNTNQSLVSTANGKYYEENTTSYIICIVIVIIGVLITILIGALRRYRDTENVVNKIEQKRYRCLSVFWAALKIYHPIVQSLVKQKNPTLAIPLVLQVISLWIYVFSIALSALVDYIYVNDSGAYRSGRGIEYAVVYLVCLLVLRPVFNKLKYCMYHGKTQVNIQQERQIDKNRKLGYTPTENQSLKNISKTEVTSSKRLQLQGPQFERSVMDHQQYEGGSSDEIEDKESYEESSYTQEEQKEGRRRESESIQSQSITKNNSQLKASGPLKNSMGPKGVQFSPVKLSEHKQSSKMPGRPAGVMDMQLGGSQDVNSSSPKISESNQSPQQMSNLIDTSIQRRSPPNRIPMRYQENIESEEGPQQQQQVQNRQDFDNIYTIPKKENKRLQPADEIIDIKDVEIEVQQNHDFKGLRIVLLLILLAMLIVILIAMFVIMKQLPDSDSLRTWVSTVIGLVIIYIVVLDTLLILVFSLTFANTANYQSGCIIFMSLIMNGTADTKARQSLLLELNA